MMMVVIIVVVVGVLWRISIGWWCGERVGNNRKGDRRGTGSGA